VAIIPPRPAAAGPFPRGRIAYNPRMSRSKTVLIYGKAG
jgi:hypothetical protein